MIRVGGCRITAIMFPSQGRDWSSTLHTRTIRVKIAQLSILEPLLDRSRAAVSRILI